MDNGQTQSAAAAFRCTFAAIKRLEDSSEAFLRDRLTLIPHANHGIVARWNRLVSTPGLIQMRVVDGHVNLSVVVRGFHGIAQQVRYRTEQVTLRTFHREVFIAHLKWYPTARAAQRFELRQREDLPHHRRCRQWHFVDRHALGEE